MAVRSFTQSRPITDAEPEVGEISPSRVRMVVLFPAPLGPMNPKQHPAGTWRVRSVTPRALP